MAEDFDTEVVSFILDMRRMNRVEEKRRKENADDENRTKTIFRNYSVIGQVIYQMDCHLPLIGAQYQSLTCQCSRHSLTITRFFWRNSFRDGISTTDTLAGALACSGAQ